MASTPPAATRPVRRRLGAEERRAQIVAATIRVVAAGGYASASADAIAAAAGVSKGLLWHYFGSQDELMAETARRTATVLRDTVAADLDMHAPVPELIGRAVAAAATLLDTHADERRAVGDIVHHLRREDGTQVLQMREWEETYTLQETHIFRRGQREGTLRADLDPRVMAVTYQAAVEGMLDYLSEYRDTDAPRFARQVAGVLLAGMTAPVDADHRA